MHFNLFIETILAEYRNGLYQGCYNDFAQREGKGVFYWNSGELYYGKILDLFFLKF